MALPLSKTPRVGGKIPFSLPVALRGIEKAVAPFRKAALFELFDKGYRSPFEQLVACLISIRTFDEATVPCAERLFSKARTPAALAVLSEQEIDSRIAPSTFHRAKAHTLSALARMVAAEYGGELPCTLPGLLELDGVGPKCASLVLGIACGSPAVAVDIHVHRVTNRWGIVRTKTPGQTMVALEKLAPRRYWTDLNRLLVPFGKHICTRVRPFCSRCPVSGMCLQVGVTSHR